jgi:hypothetical protein
MILGFYYVDLELHSKNIDKWKKLEKSYVELISKER